VADASSTEAGLSNEEAARRLAADGPKHITYSDQALAIL
jgi:hypothetical protein